MGRVSIILLVIRPTIVKSGSRLHQRSWVSVVSAVAVAGFIWLAYGNFAAQRHYSDVVFVATNLERNVPVGTKAVRDLGEVALDMVTAGECRSNLLGAGLTVLLADLDAETTDDRRVMLQSVDRFLTHMLSCTPTDGDAWARLAMVRQALGERPSEEAALLERSSWFAPSEGSTLAGRLEVWRHAMDETLVLAEPTLDRDILVALSYYSVEDAVKTLSGGGQKFRDRVSTASASLSDERVTALRRAGLDFIPARTPRTSVFLK